MHLGWSSCVYPLCAADVAKAPDYDGPAIAAEDLPDDSVVLVLRKNASDALLRGRAEAESAAAEGKCVSVRIVFVPTVAKWDLFRAVMRFLRERRRFKGTGIYRIDVKALREMGLERAVRTLANPHKRRGKNRAAKMAVLERSLKADGYDFSRPMIVMLCRSRGIDDSIRQGHHRISACIACGVDTASVRFAAAGAMPRALARLVGRPRKNPEVVKCVAECVCGGPVGKVVPMGRRRPRAYTAFPVRGESFIVDFASPRFGAPPCGLKRDADGKESMRQDFEMDALRDALESGYGIRIASLEPLPGHSHSLNFKAAADGEDVFAVKVFPVSKASMSARLLAHTASVRCPNASTRLFGGKLLDFGGWRVMALKWIDGEAKRPEDLLGTDIDSLVEAYRSFLDGLVDDGEILPARDNARLWAELLEKPLCKAVPALVRELEAMDGRGAAPAPEKIRIIHGDLHFGNFRFKDGRVSGFLDIEELRCGTPAEDMVRYFASGAEKMGIFRLGGRRRLLAAFREIVARMDLSRDEWLFAIDGYLLRRLSKKLSSRRPGWIAKMKISRILRLCRELRGVVSTMESKGKEG